MPDLAQSLARQHGVDQYHDAGEAGKVEGISEEVVRIQEVFATISERANADPVCRYREEREANDVARSTPEPRAAHPVFQAIEAHEGHEANGEWDDEDPEELGTLPSPVDDAGQETRDDDSEDE